MPPRKSDSSKLATGDEGSVAGLGAGTSTGPSTAAKREEGVNIEVTALDFMHAVTPSTHKPSGSQPPKVHSNPPCKRRPPTQHADPGQRHASHEQKRNGLCQLPIYTVSVFDLMSVHTKLRVHTSSPP